MKKNKIVYAAGVFDLLHVGHIRYLENAKSLGDFLVVGVVTDSGVQKYKKFKPVLPLEQRVEMVKALKCVDCVLVQKETDPTRELKLLKVRDLSPDIMVRADDFVGVPPGSEYIKSIGGKVVRVPYCKEVSSTIIKKKIKEGWNG